MEYLYKIRRPSDGLFFSGAGYKKKTWTKNGRSYATEAMARNALRTSFRAHQEGCGSWDDRVDLDDVEIVVYAIEETGTIPHGIAAEPAS